MTRGDGSEWGFHIDLYDLEFKGAAFTSTDAYSTMLADLLAHGAYGDGLEWGSSYMTLVSPYRSAVPGTGWEGLAMPGMGHPNVAELHKYKGGLSLELWYQNPGNAGGYYGVGDTKANAHVNPVPEPSAVLAFAVGLLVTARAIRRR